MLLTGATSIRDVISVSIASSGRWGMMARLLAVLLSVAWITGSALAETRWYRLDLGGVPAGWRKVDESMAGGLRTWVTTEFMRINRGGVPVEIEASMVWVDKVDGTPVEMRLMQKMGAQPVEATWRFLGDDIEIKTTQGGRSNTVQVPAPSEPWLTPQSAAGVCRCARRCRC